MSKMMEIHVMVNERLDQHVKITEVAKKIVGRFHYSFDDALVEVKKIQKDRRKAGLRY